MRWDRGEPRMEHLTFRFAEEKDTELLLSFIRAPAVYERLEDKVEATPEVLRRCLFEEKRAETAFAVLDGRASPFSVLSHLPFLRPDDLPPDRNGASFPCG